MKAKARVLLATVAAMALATPVLADSDDADIRALARQVEALQARVAALEAARTFTSFMPNFAERFHVMHRAGEAGDWAVASHELSEMKRLSEHSVAVDAEKGKLMRSMMGPSLESLEAAIGHADHGKFEEALHQTIETCNACHAATGSEFIEVTLDAREGLSMRHPHRLMMREMPGDHSHGMPAGHGGMMGSSPEPEKEGGHDDAGKPKHTH